MVSILKAHNLCKALGNTLILDNINLTIEPSSVVGLAGPSGSGKSTLLRCLQKLETPDSGTIEYQHKIGFMFQDFQLFPHMTVLQNLTYAPKIKEKHKDHTKPAYIMLNNLNIAAKAHLYPKNLSGGEKQRVALARSLMMHPKILLCDEPTSGLDITTILDVVTLLKSVQSMGVTMIIASHDLDFLTKTADRIILLKQGKIVVDIDPKLLHDPINYLKAYY